MLGDENQGFLIGNQVGIFEVALTMLDQRAPRRSKCGFDFGNFGADDVEHPFPAGENIPQIGNFNRQFVVFEADFVCF